MTGEDMQGGAKRFVALLEAAGFNFFTGVPCSLLEGILAVLERHPRLPYIPAVREDAAVGMASGAFLAGKRPVVLMQNSGLGTSLNALVSLNLLYKIPLLLVVSWRGYRGKDAPEHLIMGDVSPRLLEDLSLPYLALDEEKLEDALSWAKGVLEGQGLPATFLVRPGVLR